MTHDEAQAIHGRLDAITRRLEDVGKAVAVYAAQREACVELQGALKRDLWGNGKESVDKRLTKLETVSAGRTAWFWAMIAFVSALVAGVVQVAAAAFFK